MYYRNLLLALIFVFSTQSTFSQVKLCENPRGQNSPEIQQIAERMAEQGEFKRYALVQILPEKLNSPIIEANLFSSVEIILHRRDVGFPGIQMDSWTGNSPHDLTSGAFLINGNRIVGHISGPDGNFEISPLDNSGTHIILEYGLPFEKCGNEGSAHESLSLPIDGELLIKEKTRPPGRSEMTGTECFVRVICGYTDLAETNTASVFNRTMIEHISLAVLETNQGYANSDVEMRIELAYMYKVFSPESASSANDLSSLINNNDGVWDEIHAHRSFYRADMVSMITGGTYEGLCGMAAGFDYANPANMFQVTEYNCATGNYSFAHEFGHNQGCRHHNDNTGTPFSYARGLYSTGNFRTVMATPSESSNPPRVNYWSNPDIIHPTFGIATGTSTRDNARAIDFSDFTIAHHFTAPATATLTSTVNDQHIVNMFAIDLITSSSSAESGSGLELKTQNRINLTPGFWAKAGTDTHIHITTPCTGTSYSLTGDQISEEND